MNNITSRPVLGFVGFSGTGKTTLLEQLIPILRAREIKIAIIKHGHHDFDIDYPGKDSYRLRKAGACDTIVASQQRWAIIHENDQTNEEPKLAELLGQLTHSSADIVLVEGFKHEDYPRIEIHRPSLSKPLLFPEDNNIIAIATDAPLNKPVTLPVLNLNKTENIADFVHQYLIMQPE